MRARVRREAERIQQELRQGKYSDSPHYLCWIAVDGDEYREVGSVIPARIGPKDCGRVMFFGYRRLSGQDSAEWRTWETPVWTRPWLEAFGPRARADREQRPRAPGQLRSTRFTSR